MDCYLGGLSEPMYCSAINAAAAVVRWANNDEVALMNANGGKVGTDLTTANDTKMQTMEVERMFNITPGLVPIDKMREIWKYHGQNVNEDLLLHWLANSTNKAHDRRGEEQVLLPIGSFVLAALGCSYQ
ncbi:hypothetical protein MKX08_005866 [Trichoderma sp. CBMAI-0020]|nr:hypothetical protein MKX08_005866 [Trichoderma sp. CBMAI-0020]